VSEQSVYNLLERTVELEVLPAAQAYGIGVLPWSPLAGGLLAGASRKADEGRRAGGRQLLGHASRMQRVEQHRGSFDAYERLCDELGASPANVALAWLLAQPAVTAPVLGPRTLDQFTDALGALDVSLSPYVLFKLDELFPGPGGPAPEAYTW
jgi:aryl-alcohol dehydrogenase-like predicted oxidoreductase